MKGNLWDNFDRKNPKNNKRKELTLEQRTMLRDNAFLRDLYHRFYMEPGSDEYGTFLNGDQAGQIFPYEYWDKSLTIKDAKQNGLRFQEYCASLGIKPRFTGVKVKGQVIGDFSKEDGYWKLLIDRRMYNRDGTYHEVKAVSIDNIKIDSIPMAVNSNLYNDDARTEAAIEDSLKAISNEPNDLSLDGKPREEQFSTAFEITDDMAQYNEAVSRGVAEEPGTEFSRSLTSGMSTQEIDRRLGELVKKYGALPKGEKPARNVDVPMQTSDNKNTRRFVRTILESGITSADLDDNIKSAILNESLSYEVATDKDAAEYAASVIRIGGVERAQREWDKARRSDTFNKDHMALGQFLLKEYAKNNDIDNAMNMIQDLAAEGTRMGQNIQAMRMLKKYAQQVPAIGLGYIQRTVDQMNREAKAKMGKRYKEMKIAPNLATEYINAQTRDEIDAALGKIYKNLGSQVQKTVPEEIIDHLRTWRYMSMLGNPRTHI